MYGKFYLVSLSFGGEMPDKETQVHSLADAVMLCMGAESSMIYEIGPKTSPLWVCDEFDHIKREAKFWARESSDNVIEKIVKF